MTPTSRIAAVAAWCLAPAAALGQAQPAPTRPAATRPAAARPAASDPAPCRVEGTWELASVSVDGKERLLAGYKQRKVVANGRFMWIGQSARRDTIALRTVADTLRAQQVLGGSGTYSVRRNQYTERLDYFYDPLRIGQTVPATCKVEGDWWTHSFTVPFDTTAGGKIQRIVEVWQRLP
jgi:hypothetical protein